MRPALFVLVAAALAVLVGCSSTQDEAAQRGPAAAPARAASYTLTVPKLGIVSTPLMAVGLNPDHTMAVPPVEHPEQAAVYNLGPMPGQVGPAVVLGHINGGGHPGVFARLSELREGDRLSTTDPNGTVTTFQVYRATVVDKADFPTAQVYSDTPSPELRLISCGGALDRTAHSYVGQVLVFARKV